MTWGAISASWAGVMAFTVPCVPTGMKAGVCTVPWAVWKTPARAIPQRAWVSKAKGCNAGMTVPVRDGGVIATFFGSPGCVTAMENVRNAAMGADLEG